MDTPDYKISRQIYLPRSLDQQLRELAAENNRSINNQIVTLLQTALLVNGIGKEKK